MDVFNTGRAWAKPGGAVLAALVLTACAGVRTPGDVPLAAVNLFSRTAPAREYVTAAEFARVQPGMTRLRVKSLLGEPLLASPTQVDHYGYVVRLDDGTATPARYAAYDVTFQRDRVTQVTPLVP